MNGGGAADTMDDYFAPREHPWFRARLAARVAVPLDRRARSAAWRVAWSALPAAPPITVALVAPAGTLTLGAVIGLCCAALPGVVATAWSAARLRETRQLAAEALRQAGAEHRTAWLFAAGRLGLFAGAGALVGAGGLAALHDPLASVLPRRSPLRGMFAGGAFGWIQAAAMTVALVVCGALLAGAPFWARVDWGRFDPLRHGRSVANRTTFNRPLFKRAVFNRSVFNRFRISLRRESRRPR